jgi:hypothetical protein
MYRPRVCSRNGSGSGAWEKEVHWVVYGTEKEEEEEENDGDIAGTMQEQGRKEVVSVALAAGRGALSSCPQPTIHFDRPTISNRPTNQPTNQPTKTDAQPSLARPPWLNGPGRHTRTGSRSPHVHHAGAG